MTEPTGATDARSDKSVADATCVVQSNAPEASATPRHSALPAMIVGSIGVVYGDIGTSPLYALRKSLSHAAKADILTEEAVIGATSLLLYALIFTVTAKYVLFLMRADNRGEGGILSLMALAQNALGRRAHVVFLLGVGGAALFSGDAIITPAISVLSAVEGIDLVTHRLNEFVIPITIGILITLFWVQSAGTAKVAALFGPIMIVFFLVIGVLGAMHIPDAPQILRAFDPRSGVDFLLDHGWLGFAVLGSVFLGVTGAEALYADMGHFGRLPIQVAWTFFVLPALLLNYLGQGALILSKPEAIENPFFLLAPEWLLLPLVILSTVATVIASQAVVTGAFSLVRQAIQLGLLPRLEITHTSETQEGQIYIGRVNRLLLIGVLILVLVFKNSSALASAYGIAVTGTMVTTTALAFVVVWKKWGWPLWASALLIAGFLAIDLAFLAANLMKVVDGGWVPLLLGACSMVVMWTWVRGTHLLAEKTHRTHSDPRSHRHAQEIQADAGARNGDIPDQRSECRAHRVDAQSQAQQGIARARAGHLRQYRGSAAHRAGQTLQHRKALGRFYPHHLALWLHGEPTRAGGARGDAQDWPEIRHHDHLVLPGAAHDQGKPGLGNAGLAGQALCRADQAIGQCDGLLLDSLRPRGGTWSAGDDLAAAGRHKSIAARRIMTRLRQISHRKTSPMPPAPAPRHSRVIVLGSGPAGYTAAIYTARAMLEPVLIAGFEQGGQLMITTDVENYPGFAEPIQGPWLMEQMRAQAEHVGAKLVSDHVVEARLARRPFELLGNSGQLYTCDALIVATGAKARWLGSPARSILKALASPPAPPATVFSFAANRLSSSAAAIRRSRRRSTSPTSRPCDIGPSA